MTQAADSRPLANGPRSRRTLRQSLEHLQRVELGGDRLAVIAAALRTFADAPDDEQPLLEVVARTVASASRAGCAVHLFEQSLRSIATVTALAASSSPTNAGADRLLQHFAGARSIAELSMARHVADTGEGILVPDVEIDLGSASSALETLVACEELGIDSLLLVPLRVRGRSIGLLALFRDASTSHFDARDGELARMLADQAALAIENRRLSANMEARSLAHDASRQELSCALEQLRHADRLATIGAMVAGIAHEVGTPLHVIAGYAELMASGHMGPEAMSAKAAVIRGQVDNVARILRQLLDFARTSIPDGEPASALQVATDVAELLAPIARSARISLRVSGEPVSTVLDGQRLSQVMVNLITNALHASFEGGVVEVSVHAVHRAPPGDTREVPYVQTVIRDSGIGMTDAVKARLFEPFFTTKAVGKGTGLGLSVVAGIVKEHAGWVTVDSAPGAGSRFSVYLPAADHPTEAEPDERPQSAPS